MPRRNSRITIAWDVDDVLGRCDLAWMAWLPKIGYSHIRPEDFKTYTLTETLKCSKEEVTKILDGLFASEDFQQMPAVEEAKWCLNELQSLNHVAISGRPAHLKRMTETWLERNFPGTFSRVYTVGSNPVHNPNSTKGTLCQELGVLALIEDAPYHAESCLPFTNVLLKKQYWNTNFTKIHHRLHRFEHYHEIRKILKTIKEIPHAG